MARSRAGAGPWLGGSISIIALAVFFACSAAPALALTGGAPTPAGSAPPPPSISGTPDPAPSAGTLSLVSARTSPRKSFYYSARAPRLRYEIGSDQASNDLRIDVVGEGGEVVKSFYRNDIAPETPDSVRWDGTDGNGKPAHNGHYSFRIVSQSGGGFARRATSSSAEPLGLGFDLYRYAFPILGPHDYGGAAGRFPAPSARRARWRAGRSPRAAPRRCGIRPRRGAESLSRPSSQPGTYQIMRLVLISDPTE